MKQGRRGAWLTGLCGGVVLGVWGLACGPVPESEAPVDEVAVEQGAADEESVGAQWHPPAPLPPSMRLAVGPPAVASGSGKFFVVWPEVREGGIYGARLKPDGTLLDPEGIRLNPTTEVGRAPAVAYDGKNFLVVWETIDGVFGIRVKPDGSVLGPLLTVIRSSESDAPAIACSDKKLCLVTFTVEGTDGDTIGFRRVTREGEILRPPIGTSLGTGTTLADESSIAWDGKNFLVVWSDTIGGATTPDIYGARVSLDGRILDDPDGLPISTAAGAQRSPDVVWTGRRFLTVWEDSREGPFVIFGTRVRKDMTLDDPNGFRISPTEFFDAVDPAVAHHNSKSLVVWRGGDGILGARVNEEGDVLDPDAFVIALESDEQFFPDVALGSSRFLTAYGHGGTSEPPFELRAKVVRHDTRVEDFVDITRAFEVRECSLVDLGTLGGRSSLATAVNERGQVIGYSFTADGSYHGFFWTAQGGMVDLGTLVEPAAVNERGQVVGRYATADGDSHAFLWTAQGGMVDLGTLGGSYSYATAVNERGQVVGASQTADGSGHAFLWTAQGGMVDLGTLGGSSSSAVAVNERGQVVGGSDTADGGGHAFLWTAQGGMVDLGDLGSRFSYATAVNERGQVVGNSDTADGSTHAFLWTAQGGMVDLGTLGGRFSHATAVNERGQVVGGSTTSDDEDHGHAFSWTAQGGMVDLGTLGGIKSSATAVNDRGQVVGGTENSDENAGRAFSWTAQGGMVDLGTLGGPYTWAAAVNERGQIVGHGDTADGGAHAFLGTCPNQHRPDTTRSLRK